MKVKQEKSGAWSFIIDAEELPHASTQVGLAALLSQLHSATPPENVIQRLLASLETVPRKCVSSLIDHLGVLPEPSSEELAAIGFTYDELGKLTPQQEEDLALKVRVLDLQITIRPGDAPRHSQPLPFYNMRIEDPLGRVWAVGDDFIDFG